MKKKIKCEDPAEWIKDSPRNKRYFGLQCCLPLYNTTKVRLPFIKMSDKSAVSYNVTVMPYLTKKADPAITLDKF